MKNDVYKKIHKALNEGKIVLVDLTCDVKSRERFRLLTKKSAHFDWFNSHTLSLNTCCWHIKGELVDCNIMKDYDKELDLKIVKYQVLD